MNNKTWWTSVLTTGRIHLTAVIVAAVAGAAGVAVLVRKAAILYAGTEQIGRNADTIRLISQISASIAVLILTVLVLLLINVLGIDDAENRIAVLRRNNLTAMIAAPMIDILMLTGGSELIQTPMQAGIPSGSSLATICTIVGAVGAFTAHAVLAALVLSFISFRRIILGSKEPPENGKLLRMVVVGSVALQIIVSLLHAACALNALAIGASDSKMAEAVACSFVHSIAFTVLLVIFVRCWQRLAAECDALAADEQPEELSGTAD